MKIWKEIVSPDEMQKLSLVKLQRTARKGSHFCEVDHIYQKDKKLSLTQYMICQEIFNKQNLPQRFAKHRSGWYWGSRKAIAELFNISVDSIDKLIKRRPDLIEVSEEGYLRVIDWKPDLDKAYKERKLSIIYPHLATTLHLSYEEFTVMSYIANYVTNISGMQCHFSDEKIAEKLDMSARSVNTYIKRLEARGMLLINRYRAGMKQRHLELGYDKKSNTFKDRLVKHQEAIGRESISERKQRLALIRGWRENHIPVPRELLRPGGMKSFWGTQKIPLSITE